MKNLFLLLCLSLSSYAIAQAPKFKETSDPEARKTLTKLKDKYKAIACLEGEYSLTIENGKNKEIQSGKMVQKGQKFRVNNAGNELICDGKVVWMYQKSGAAANSVQINDYDPNDEEMVSPANIMKIYENEKKFIYAIVNDNPTAQEIEFKPLDKKADYSKIRITVDKSLNTIKQVKIFGKDGIRYTLDIKRLDPANYPDTHFTFDKAKYPGVKVSDLRE